MSLRPILNFSFASRSTARIGGACEAYFPQNTQEFILLIDRFLKNGSPFKVVGRASNLLASDEPLKTKIIFTDHLCGVVPIANGLRLEAGVRLSRIIYQMAKDGRCLLPELIGVPGSVGGMVLQNASCYGREISEGFVSARLYDLRMRKIIELSREQMQFSYRASLLKNRQLVLVDADFCFLNLKRDPMQIIFDVTKKRKLCSPEGPSLGCVFLKHEGVSIGALLDQLGQKGKRFGNIAVSRRHAGILVNLGGASCIEFTRAVATLSQLVFTHYGFVPKCEIEFLD